ncbi:MAG: Fe(3+) dicitrate transport protein [Candidatus Omnitrophota bacterium]|jgi:Fe(3+) dicitrate transport protein
MFFYKKNKLHMNLIRFILTCFVFLNILISVEAQEEWDTVTVLGVRDDVVSLPGSAALISTDDIRTHSYDDINRVLRKVPGVYVREEDGYGLFPNISLRGVDPARSGKVTLMEDGITASPAPYSAPSAYYSPTAGRMIEIEVLKGSSQVKYGPHTTGGVINYKSTPVPENREIYLKSLYGTDDERRLHFYFGDTVETDHGNFGVLVEEYYRQTDGFKKIDETADFSDGDKTGFKKSEPMLKAMWESPEDATYQRLEGKVGYSNLDANETYTGLTEVDFEDNPYRRYAATRFDNIETWNLRKSLSYTRELSDNVMWNVTGYMNEFDRNWFKLNKVGGVNISQALSSNDGGGALAILKGQAAGSFEVKNNRRHYNQYGTMSDFNVSFDTGDVEHALEVGFKIHQDYIRRDQNSVTYTQDANGVITGSVVGAPGTAGNRKQESHAFATYVRDNVTYGALTLSPGIRYERVGYKYLDFDTSGADPSSITGKGSSNLEALAGGIGANYEVADNLSFFAGVHQGFSVPGPRDNARSAIKEETSLTTEVGVRYQPTKASNVELVGFYTDFDDLLVSDNVGGSGSGATENVGDVISKGLELKASYDYGVASEKEFRNPYYVSFTYTDSTLDGNSNSTDAESIFAGGVDGAKVPYVPELQFSLGTGFEKGKWGFALDGTFVAETFTTASNTEHQARTDGTLDSRYGKTDEYFVIDLSGEYQVNANARVFANIHNVGDVEYVVSRHPHGPRPGKPFTALAGVELKF